MDSPELHVNQLQQAIAELVTDFERSTDIRVDKLEIDNRMRGVGGCAAHQILVSADIDW